MLFPGIHKNRLLKLLLGVCVINSYLLCFFLYDDRWQKRGDLDVQSPPKPYVDVNVSVCGRGDGFKNGEDRSGNRVWPREKDKGAASPPVEKWQTHLNLVY